MDLDCKSKLSKVGSYGQALSWIYCVSYGSLSERDSGVEASAGIWLRDILEWRLQPKSGYFTG